MFTEWAFDIFLTTNGNQSHENLHKNYSYLHNLCKQCTVGAHQLCDT